MYLEVVRQLLPARVAGVHGDEHGTGGVKGQLRALEHEAFQVGIDSVLDGRYLLGYDGQYLKLNAIELVEARPCARLCQTLEELAHRLEVQAVGTVEDHTLEDMKRRPIFTIMF